MKPPSIRFGNLIYGGKHYVTTDVRRSILECRKAFHDMTDLQFAAWYEKRYKIKGGAVLAVIRSET